jgi:NAD+ synthase (glutamine-hydrolysing)
MSNYGVNAGVPKTLVRALVEHEAECSDNQALKDILMSIIDTPISPELVPGKQETEDLVGPYELHDFFIYHTLRWGCSPSKVYRLAKYVFEGRYSDQVIAKWLDTFYSRFFAQQFKRSCLPDGPKVGSVSLSPRGDWRMPSDATVKEWKRELRAELED